MTEDDTNPFDDYLELPLPEDQQKAVDEARRQLEALGVDISDMPDRTVITHLVVLQEIAENRGMMIDDALTEYGAKFADLRALTTVLLAPDEALITNNEKSQTDKVFDNRSVASKYRGRLP
jgi:hypothetical protein